MRDFSRVWAGRVSMVAAAFVTWLLLFSLPVPVGSVSSATTVPFAASTSTNAPAAGAWTEFRYDSAHTGQSPLSGPSGTVQVLWTFPEGRPANPSPIQPNASTVVAVGGAGGIAELNALGLQTGFWRGARYGVTFSSPLLLPNGRVVVSTLDGIIHGVNVPARHGWNQVVGGAIYSSPTLGTSRLFYVGSDDGHLYAIGVDGRMIWNYSAGSPIRSSPAVGPGGQVYFGTMSGKLYALRPNGTLNWTYQTGGGVFSSPAVGGNGTVYFGSEDGSLYALFPNGTLDWSFPTGGGIMSSPAVARDGTILVGSNDSDLYAIASNGTLRWSYATGGPLFSSPALDRSENVYIGGTDGTLYSVSPAGTLNWAQALGDPIYGSPIVGFNGTIYVSVSKVGLYAVGALPHGTVTFVESGLPAGTPWTASIGSTSLSTNNTSVSIRVPLGSYSYSLGPGIIACGYGCQFEGGTCGLVAVATNVTLSASWTKQFLVTMAVADRLGAYGTILPKAGTLWVDAGSNLSISARAGALSVFLGWTTNSSAISLANSSGSSTTALIGGPGKIIGHFGSGLASLPALTPVRGAGVAPSAPPALASTWRDAVPVAWARAPY